MTSFDKNDGTKGLWKSTKRMYSNYMDAILLEARRMLEEGKVGEGMTKLNVKPTSTVKLIFPDF